MVTCPNCGAEVNEGKFCEKCGSPLDGASAASSSQAAQPHDACPNCGHPNNGGKFCEKCGTPLVGGVRPAQTGQKTGGFFDNISNSINKTASSILAIKSDYNNNTVIYRVNKIPNVKEKTIKVEDYEVLFFNQGSGFMKYNQTFKTELNSFVCFYMKNATFLNNTFSVDTKTKIKKLDTEDELNVKINFIMTLEVEDIDKFFNVFTGIRQDTWREVDVNSQMSSNLKSIIEQNTINMLSADGNLDLRNPKDQISSFAVEIRKLVEEEIKQYGLRVNTFSVNSVNVDMNEVNKILINNLYKGE